MKRAALRNAIAYGEATARCTALQPHCRRLCRAVAFISEHTPPRSKEDPDAARGGVRLAVREDRPMLHYMHAWLPLLSVSLTAAVVFALASFIIGGAEF